MQFDKKLRRALSRMERSESMVSVEDAGIAHLMRLRSCLCPPLD